MNNNLTHEARQREDGAARQCRVVSTGALWAYETQIAFILDRSGSMDSIALAVTALLGIVSYFVQAKLSRDAERSQKESDRTHADIVRVEANTENQLTRVQTQMERFVQPFSASISQTAQAILNTMGELGLQFQIEHWQLAWLKVSAAPKATFLLF